MAIETLTFGCRLNAYEGEVMKAEAEKAGLDNTIIINSGTAIPVYLRQVMRKLYLFTLSALSLREGIKFL